MMDRAGVEWNGRTFGELEDWEQRRVLTWAGEELEREVRMYPRKGEGDQVVTVLSKPQDAIARGDRVRYVGPSVELTPDDDLDPGRLGTVLHEAREIAKMLLVRVAWDDVGHGRALDLQAPGDLERA